MKKTLVLKGKAAVFIDWANVYGWRKSLKTTVNIHQLYKYLRSHPEIEVINFYYGEDIHPKSRSFVQMAISTGYTVISKPVKYILIDKAEGLRSRKCDFDLEIAVDVMKSLHLNKYETYIFFSGDGDFAALYHELLKRNKQVIVIFARNHAGRELFQPYGDKSLVLLRIDQLL